MITKHFKKEDLREVIWGDSDTLERIEDNIVDTTRWSVCHDLIFKSLDDGLYYQVDYSVGATECQDERAFEDEGDLISCTQVIPVPKTITVYEPA